MLFAWFVHISSGCAEFCSTWVASMIISGGRRPWANFPVQCCGCLCFGWCQPWPLANMAKSGGRTTSFRWWAVRFINHPKNDVLVQTLTQITGPKKVLVFLQPSTLNAARET
jgi:hypothetical protein